jgi:hypothetical protein
MTDSSQRGDAGKLDLNGGVTGGASIWGVTSDSSDEGAGIFGNFLDSSEGRPGGGRAAGVRGEEFFGKEEEEREFTGEEGEFTGEEGEFTGEEGEFTGEEGEFTSEEQEEEEFEIDFEDPEAAKHAILHLKDRVFALKAELGAQRGRVKELEGGGGVTSSSRPHRHRHPHHLGGRAAMGGEGCERAKGFNANRAELEEMAKDLTGLQVTLDDLEYRLLPDEEDEALEDDDASDGGYDLVSSGWPPSTCLVFHIVFRTLTVTLTVTLSQV